VTEQEEMDSPRGRIVLMKEVLEGDLTYEAAMPFIDNCLGCQACETACPSGVPYGDLITSFRAQAEHEHPRRPSDRWRRAIFLEVLARPRLLRAALLMSRVVRPARRLLPEALGAPLELAPRAPRGRPEPLPSIYPAQGERRGRVALLVGCAQEVLEPEINRATLRVLAANGIETVVPKSQGCCGSLALHAGAEAAALRHARRNLGAFPRDVDAVLTNAAGCGSGMKDYRVLFHGQPDESEATELAGRVRDVTEFLDEIGLVAEPPVPRAPLTVAYQDACHLAHAQKIRSAPRRLIEQIPDVRVTEPLESGLCCGSAGIYNIDKPRIARELGQRKTDQLLALGADLIVTGNIGCMTQLRSHFTLRQSDTPVIHTMQLLDRAYARTLWAVTPPMTRKPI
jgi:glycolate oxidase iron-sulfur subunit